MECDAGFLWERRVQCQGREYQRKLERIGKTHMIEIQLVRRFWGTGQGRDAFLSLSGAMLLGGLASSWSNVIS